MSDRSDSRPLPFAISLVLGPSLGSSWILCCFPVSWRSCIFECVDQTPSCAPADHRWGGYWGESAHSPGSGPGWFLDWSAHQLSLIITDLSSTAPASSSNDISSRGCPILLLACSWGELSHTYTCTYCVAHTTIWQMRGRTRSLRSLMLVFLGWLARVPVIGVSWSACL